MRYNVHPPRAFRNRIAKTLGVLVAAALIATLGLPSAAQAQVEVKAPDAVVDFMKNKGFQVDNPMGITDYATHYRIIYSKDGGAMKKLPAADEAPANVSAEVATGSEVEIQADSREDHGTWSIQLQYHTEDTSEAGVEGDSTAAEVLDRFPTAGPVGDATVITIGPPAAPRAFNASPTPSGYVLTWTDVEDGGIKESPSNMKPWHKFRTGADADWVDVTYGAIVEVDLEPGDYVFMLRAVGKYSNDANVKPEDDVPGAVATTMVTVTAPVPTPTLPEIALLLLAMLLLGSGAYQLRRRQSGGLTHA